MRASIQALASVLGGVQSMALSCYDEALAIPTTEAQRIALRTQQIIAHETGVTDTADPFGGSYYVEALTDEIEAKAQEYIDRIEDMGGAVAAIESGYMQTEIQEAAVQQQQDIESGARVVVGVNKFRSDEEPEPMIFRVNTELSRGQMERLRRVRADARQRQGRRGAANARRNGARRREPDARDPRRRARIRDAGRDLRRAAAGLGRVPAADRRVASRLPIYRRARVLTPAATALWRDAV